MQGRIDYSINVLSNPSYFARSQSMTEENEPHFKYNSKKRILGSLASRVLLISFVFVVVPLILYSIIIYKRDYQGKIHSVFHELALIDQEQLGFIDEFETFHLNFLSALYSLLENLQNQEDTLEDKTIKAALSNFANHGDLSAIFFLKPGPNKTLICSDSTLPAYLGFDFSEFFTASFLSTIEDNVFIAKDPTFQTSLYLCYTIRDKNLKIVGFVLATIAIDKFLHLLDSRRTVYQTNISIIDRSHIIIASTEKSLVNQQVHLKTNSVAPPQSIELTPRKEFENAFQFTFMNKKRFAILSKIPLTEYYILTSVPSKIILIQMYEYIWHLVSFLLFILVVGGIAAYLLTCRMSRPLKRLGQVMMKVGQGNLQERFEEDSLGFEINYLGEEFNETVISLITYIEEAKKERASKEAYAKELQIGHTIQQSILPEKQTSFPGIDVAVYFTPAKEVAGDFYDWLIQGNRVLLTIADGVGKGVSGALYSFDLRSILRSFATTHTDLTKIVTETNNLFMHDTKETGSFVTAFVASFDNNNKTLTYTNCGHNYPIVKKASGEIYRLSINGLAFGVSEFKDVATGEYILTPGDFIIFYTDGVSEAQNSEAKLFTEKRLEAVIKNSAATTPDLLVKDIVEKVQEFVGTAEQYDDMTIIAFKLS